MLPFLMCFKNVLSITYHIKLVTREGCTSMNTRNMNLLVTGGCEFFITNFTIYFHRVIISHVFLLLLSGCKLRITFRARFAFIVTIRFLDINKFLPRLLFFDQRSAGLGTGFGGARL